MTGKRKHELIAYYGGPQRIEWSAIAGVKAWNKSEPFDLDDVDKLEECLFQAEEFVRKLKAICEKVKP